MSIQMNALNVQEVSIDKVIPYWHNPRNNEKTVERLVISIRENGFNVPLVVDKNMVLITGHARLKAAKKLGMQSIPCIITNLTEEKAKKYRISDNKIQELTSWVDDELFKELREIGDHDELLTMGFDSADIKDIIGSFDAAIQQVEQVASAPVFEPTQPYTPPVTSSNEPYTSNNNPVMPNEPVMPAEPAPVYATAAAMPVDNTAEKERLMEQLRKREQELNGRFVKESIESHDKDNLVVCPHCGQSFKVRGLT